ncbi:MAG: hypothetical protein WBB82_01300 [Limnothrix sp.]
MAILNSKINSLKIVNELNETLALQNIGYCHWKSNEHVDAAVQGKTDLDVLVDKAKQTELEAVLKTLDFKHFEAVPYRRYLNIEDYVTIDKETGVLVHLHLHYQLDLGEKQIKGYHFPWESLLLSSRIYDDEHQIYISEPNIEIILLIVRVTLKVRNRDHIQRFLGHNYFEGDFVRELQWLKARIDLAKVKQLSDELLGEDASALILEMISSKDNDFNKLLSPTNPIWSAVKKYRLNPPGIATILRWGKESQIHGYRVLKKLSQGPVLTRRTPVTGGMIVAVLGADGSGKSTTTTEITRCLAKKVDVFPVYLGSGDGKASILRQPLILMSRVVNAVRSPQSSTPSVEGTKASLQRSAQVGLHKNGKRSMLSSLGKILWAVILTYEKQNKLKQAYRAREKGMIVVCDRYPQTQFLGFNDGPLLGHENDHSSKLLKILRQWELRAYQQMTETMPPDLVIKLNVTPEIALARKSDTPPDIVQRKVTAVKALAFPPQTTVIDINAEQPLNDVLVTAKRAVWENL